MSTPKSIIETRIFIGDSCQNVFASKIPNKPASQANKGGLNQNKTANFRNSPSSFKMLMVKVHRAQSGPTKYEQTIVSRSRSASPEH
jgi:hypothetical protein